ncbi:hypothetical protein [Arthrobacter sp. 92]|uniref:hypothetical protein n=1 Tax=Arthrobacter sp. 92 TaxID=3418175 RepID=UPI003D049D53
MPSRTVPERGPADGRDHTLGVTGVGHDPGDHPRAWRADMSPDMFVDAQRIHTLQPAGGADPPSGLCPDPVPDRVPGDANLVGQSGNRGVEALQSVGRTGHGAGGEFCPWPGQRVLLGERCPVAVRVRATPDTLGLQQPHRPAETRNVMEPDLASAVPDRNDAAIRTTREVATGFDAQEQAGPAVVTKRTWMPSTPSCYGDFGQRN